MKVAVIGAGISGLGAAWILSQKYEVHLFEAAPILGGHAHTAFVDDEGQSIPVDTGFLVYNELTYPNLISFFKTLNVETAKSDMSLAIRAGHKNLEWAGTNLDSVFAQRKNLFKPSFIKMLLDIKRFHSESEENLIQSRKYKWSLGELIHRGRYSQEFRRDYLLPIGAAIWSTPEVNMEDFPAETFLTFFINHKLLQISDRPVWRTVQNGSIQYVNKVAAKIPFVHAGTPVRQVERLNGKVSVQVPGEKLWFDKVVFATHAPITLKILKTENDHERKILSAVQNRGNRTLLHQDEEMMPSLRKCWSSWNVFSSSDKSKTTDISLTYYINKLQPLATKNNYFVTLNPRTTVGKIIREYNYNHPQFDQRAIDAQSELPSIQGQGGVYFAGAWTRYGFHEDGLLSAVKVAELMGVKPPWSLL
jgi:predicted NAD/FAD-binding protein